MSERTPKHARRGQRGTALVLSLILVFVCAGLGAAFIQVASSSASRQSHEIRQLQAFYLAEAGLAEGFMAVRMGRTGSVASEATPATYGDGEIFVESVHTSDGRVFLRSSAERERSSAVLGLIVKPPPPVLGFFADEDLVIEDVLLVDGFDSTERSYAEEVRIVEGLAEPESPNDPTEPSTELLEVRSTAAMYEQLLTRPHLESILGPQLTPHHWFPVTYENYDELFGGAWGWTLVHSPIEPRDYLSDEQFSALIGDLRDLRIAHEAGVLFEDQATSPDSPEQDFTALEEGFAAVPPDDPQRLQQHTVRGGLLGSNGDVHFVGSAAGAEIHGSVIPGVDGSVHGAAATTASGSTDSRALPAELEEVVIPTLPSEGDRQIQGGIPEIISGEALRYGSLTVGPSEDLLLRGPVTLVVDRLDVADDARLTLDTAFGSVNLYVTDSMILSPSSTLETTSDSSDEVSIHGSSDAALGSTLDLSATSRFHGTIYAPSSEVRVGSNFEVFGGIVARKLTISAGARLHFDDPSYDGETEVPLQESWRILELPEVARRGIPSRPEPGSMQLGLAHDIVGVEMEIRYVDTYGLEQVYAGAESGFDYNTATEVVSASRRVASATAEAEASDSPDWWDRWGRDATQELLDHFESDLSPESFLSGVFDLFSNRGG